MHGDVFNSYVYILHLKRYLGIYNIVAKKIEKDPIFSLFTKTQNSPVESLTVPPRQLVSGRGGSVDFSLGSSSRCPYGSFFSRRIEKLKLNTLGMLAK